MRWAWPWIVSAGAGAFLYRAQTGPWDPLLVPIIVAIVLCDLLYVVGGPHRFSRVAPVVATSGLWLGNQGGLACLFGLFVGGLVVLFSHPKFDVKVVEAGGKSLLPFALAPLLLTDPTPSISRQFFALQVYLVVSLLFPPKEGVFRFDILLLLGGPGVGLGLVTVAKTDVRLVILMLPILVALACTREDSMALVGRLRQLLGMTQSKDDQIRFLVKTSQELLSENDPEKLKKLVQTRSSEAPRPELVKFFQRQGKVALKSAKQQRDLKQAVKNEARQRERLTGLMGAAHNMASTLEAPELEQALRASIGELISYTNLCWADHDFPEPELLQQARATNQPLYRENTILYPHPGLMIETKDRDLMDVLVRIYATCRQNVDTLEELKDSQARLLDSSRMAAVGRLAAGVAHELNTPLGAISLSAEHAARQIERDRLDGAKKNLDVILQAAEKSRLTVNRLSSYSRPPRDAEKTQSVLLSAVLDDTLALLQQRILANEFQITTDIDDQLRISAIPLDIYSVMNNLITNAMDALGGDAPPRKIDIKLRREDALAVFSVDDNGPGVPLELREQVFEAFFTTKPVGLGMGLGLHLCSQVVAGIGGDIIIQESPLGGARFVVRFQPNGTCQVV